MIGEAFSASRRPAKGAERVARGGGSLRSESAAHHLVVFLQSFENLNAAGIGNAQFDRDRSQDNRSGGAIRDRWFLQIHSGGLRLVGSRWGARPRRSSRATAKAASSAS